MTKKILKIVILILFFPVSALAQVGTTTAPAQRYEVQEYYSSTPAPEFKNEILSERTSNSVTYVRPDGRKVKRFYDRDAFYKDQNQEWKQIGTDILPVETILYQNTLFHRIYSWLAAPLVYAQTYFGDNDGVMSSGGQGSWLGARTAGGSTIDSTATPEAGVCGSRGTGTMYVKRGGWQFKTALDLAPDEVVESASFFLYGYTWAGQRFYVTDFSPASSSTLAAGDFDATEVLAPIKYSSLVATTSWNLAGYNEIVLNTEGIAAVQEGTTALMTRCEYDADNTGDGTSEAITGAYLSAYAGTDHDPYLEVVIGSSTPAASGTASTVSFDDGFISSFVLNIFYGFFGFLILHLAYLIFFKSLWQRVR